MAAVAALCSCSNNEVLEAPESLKTPIAFGTYVGNSVDGRAAVIDQTALESEDGINDDSKIANTNKGFGVFAYYTEQKNWTDVAATAKPNFMYNQQVTNVSTNKWTYSPLKYWPNNTDARVSFFAYAPYSTSENKQNITIPEQASMQDAKLGFTVNPTVKNQVDLLWASVTNQKKNNSTDPVDVEDKVTFTFNHALARVGFTVQAIVDEVSAASTAVDGQTTISVESVELIGKFHKSGTINLETGDFEALSTISNDYITEAVSGEDLDASYKGGDLTSNTALVTTEKAIGYGFTLTNTNSNFKSVAGHVTNTQQVLNTEDSYIMLIPQTFNNTSKVRIRVTYKVTTLDPALGTSSVITNIVTSTPFDFDFEAQKAYTFNLQLGMTSVKFNATVSDWIDETGEAVNVPINTTGN